jgi:8-oxo-dGTP pyrophosphatase MutT (NUDIX family)
VNSPDPVHVGPWQRRSRETVYQNPWITVWHDEVTRPNGSHGVYGVVHLYNVATGAVVLDDDDRVLLVGQHRYPQDEWSWEIPEGGVPPTEPILDGIKREVREETGVEATDWRELGRARLSNSVTDELAVLFSARVHAHGEPEPDPTEELEVKWLPFDEVLAMTLDGRITDVLTVVAIQRVALERLAPDRYPVG